MIVFHSYPPRYPEHIELSPAMKQDLREERMDNEELYVCGTAIGRVIAANLLVPTRSKLVDIMLNLSQDAPTEDSTITLAHGISAGFGEEVPALKQEQRTGVDNV